MTLVDATERGTAAVEEGAPGFLRRMWEAPLWTHLLALAVVLVALLPIVGTDASFSADEGAAIVQAQSLADGGGWVVEHPLPEADPSSQYFPIELSGRGTNGVAPFSKHPLYAVAMAAADKAGGVTAMMIASLLGTLGAAAATAALAGRLQPSLRRPAVWTVGLASPLLFDGFLVMAHTLGAAAVALAALVAVVALERRKPALAVLVGPLLVVAVLLRTEATLLTAALGFVAAVVGLRRPVVRRTALLVAGSAFGAAAVARVLERAWAASIVGGPVAVPSSGDADPYGFLEGRLHAFVLTWLRPSYDGPLGVDLALIILLAGLALGAFVARRCPQDGSGIRLAGALVVSGGLLAVLAAPYKCGL